MILSVVCTRVRLLLAAVAEQYLPIMLVRVLIFGTLTPDELARRFKPVYYVMHAVLDGDKKIPLIPYIALRLTMMALPRAWGSRNQSWNVKQAELDLDNGLLGVREERRWLHDQRRNFRVLLFRCKQYPFKGGWQRCFVD